MRKNLRPFQAVTLVAIAIAFVLIISTQSVRAQTFSVLYDFPFLEGPQEPTGVTIDRAGALYGGTVYSNEGTEGGTVYKLTNHGSLWSLTALYTFPPTTQIYTEVIIGANGSLYGTTLEGGGGSCDYGCGTVFNLTPPLSVCEAILCYWSETVLYRFLGGSDGALPYGLVFDQNGNLHGATFIGGASDKGTVYELTPSGNGWTKTILHSFSGADGANPGSGVILDDAGNLYGTTEEGGSQNYGVVYELSPSGSGWTEQVLYSFSNGSDGDYPIGGLVRDRSGNLYGTSSEGSGHGGTVFELTPSGGGWNYTLVYSFAGQGGPDASLTMDAAGNLYGTTAGDGLDDDGNVFELTPSGDGWMYTSLHDFEGYDGDTPDGSVALDGSGNIFGTTLFGGTNDYGVVFEITR